MRTRGSCRFPTSSTAFRAYAREFPRNCVLLVDTYDVEQGVRNAITVGLEMRARGERLAGIRIDSGDLAWLAKMARRMLDEAGLGRLRHRAVQRPGRIHHPVHLGRRRST